MLMTLSIALSVFMSHTCYIDIHIRFFIPIVYLRCNYGCHLYFSIVFCIVVLHNVQLTL